MSWLASMFGGGKAEKDMDEHLDALRKQTREIDHKLRNLDMKLSSISEPLSQLVEEWQRQERGVDGKSVD
jgi:prefoldin subunit 5